MRLVKGKNTWVFLGVTVTVITAALMARRPWNTKARAATAPESGVHLREEAPALTHVEVVHPRSGGLERSTTQPGSVRAFQYEELFAKVPGYLRNQTKDIGDRVRKGDLLAEIHAPELTQEVARAAATLEQAKAVVVQVTARIDAAKAAVEAAAALVEQRQAEVVSAAANLRFRKMMYTRYKDLATGGSVDLQIVDEKFEQQEAAQSRSDAAVAAVKTAKADTKAKQADVTRAEGDLIEAKANVAVAQAALDKAKVMLGYTKIVSDYDGVITQRNFHNGDFIREADRGEHTPLFVVQRTDLMRVVVFVPDSEVPFADAGDPADIVIDNLPEEQLDGYKVSRVSYSEDEKSRTMRVEIDVPNTKGLLRDGMYGRVTIHLERPRPSAFTVPSASIVHTTGQKTKAAVYVVRDGVAHLVSVKLGQDNGKEAEVFGELKATDDVVVEHSGLSEGQQVVGALAALAHRSSGH